MILLYLVAAICGLLSMILGLLPGPEFLALPEVAYSAVGTVGDWTAWALGLAGSEIKSTLLAIIPIIIGINIALSLWSIIRTWKAPIVGRFITQ